MMASKEEQTHRVNVSIDKESQLGDEWTDWKENFRTDAAAGRHAIRKHLLEGEESAGWTKLSLEHFAVVALLAAAIGALIGQAFVVFDATVAYGLTALALLVVGGVRYLYDR